MVNFTDLRGPDVEPAVNRQPGFRRQSRRAEQLIAKQSHLETSLFYLLDYC